MAGIGKLLPALAGWYLVWYVLYFLYCKIWRELHIVKFCGNSPQKGGLVHQKGGRSEGKRGSRQMYDTEGPYRVSLRYRLGKYRENTNRYHTEIPNRDTTLLLFSVLGVGGRYISPRCKWTLKRKRVCRRRRPEDPPQVGLGVYRRRRQPGRRCGEFNSHVRTAQTVVFFDDDVL